MITIDGVAERGRSGRNVRFPALIALHAATSSIITLYDPWYDVGQAHSLPDRVKRSQGEVGNIARAVPCTT
jgi:hypothetical protein